MDDGELLVPPFDCSRVYHRLYVGSVPHESSDLRPFNAIALCAEEFQPLSLGVPNITVIRCPLKDEERLQQKTIADLDVKSADIAREWYHGAKVLCTCMAGINRSALLAGMVMWRISGMTGKSIVQQIRDSRIPSLENLTFRRFLSSLPAL